MWRRLRGCRCTSHTLALHQTLPGFGGARGVVCAVGGVAGCGAGPAEAGSVRLRARRGLPEHGQEQQFTLSRHGRAELVVETRKAIRVRGAVL